MSIRNEGLRRNPAGGVDFGRPISKMVVARKNQPPGGRPMSTTHTTNTKIIKLDDAVRIVGSPTNYIARTIYYADNVAILESDSGKWIEWPLTDLIRIEVAR
jgi:hypothetical protein